MTALAPALALCAALAVCGVPGDPARSLAQAKGAPAPVQDIDAPRFLLLAHSSNAMQARASQLFASRDTRPEGRAFARAMLEFRGALGAKLEALARERSVGLPTGLELEPRAIVENLEPLDSLELSRRHAEVEVDALEQELAIWRIAPASDDAIQALATASRWGTARPSDSSTVKVKP